MKLTVDDLLTPAVRDRLQAVLDFGARKHAEPGPESWPNASFEIHMEHAEGHVMEQNYKGGPDDESVLPSCDHAAVRLLMAIATQERER